MRKRKSPRGDNARGGNEATTKRGAKTSTVITVVAAVAARTSDVWHGRIALAEGTGGCRVTTGGRAWGVRGEAGVADVILGRGAIPTGGSEDFGFIRVVSSTFRRWIPRLVCSGQPAATPVRFDPSFFGISPRTRAARRPDE